jgi:hypothetical protein
MFWRKRLTALSLVILAPGAASSQEQSVVTVPLSVEIATLETHVNSLVPNPLINESKDLTCIEAERLCTKIPEFRGLKIYSRMECIDITPRVDCRVEQTVVPQGPLRLTAEGRTIIARQTLAGSATVMGRGEIGSHIQETARGSVAFTVTARPGIRPDWSVEMPLAIDFSFVQRPEAELFGFIPVTFGTETERALRGAISAFEAQTLPAKLAEIDLRSQLAPLWRELQRPAALDLRGGSKLWLHFVPDAVGIAPLQGVGGRLSTTVSVTGRIWVTESEARPFPDGAPSEAPPDLTPVSEGGVNIVVPVRVSLATLESELGAALPRTEPFSVGPISGDVTANTARLEAAGERIVLRLDAHVAISNAPDFDGTLVLSAIPSWDAEAEALVLREPRVTAENGDIAGALLLGAGFVAAVVGVAGDALAVPLAVEIDGLEEELARALGEGLEGIATVETDLAISARDLGLDDDAVRLTLQASGKLALTGLTLR